MKERNAEHSGIAERIEIGNGVKRKKKKQKKENRN